MRTKETNAIRFKEWDCVLDKCKYAENDNTAILLYGVDDYSPIATAIVNLSISLPENQAYIKDYSENEGMLEALKKVGVVKKVIGCGSSGYIDMIPLCELDLDVIAKLMIKHN